MKNYTKKEIDRHGNVFYLNEKDQYHRIDGPAVEYVDGDINWFINGKLHREDGPAVEYPEGDKFYYINGEFITKECFLYTTKYKESYKFNL